MDAIDILLVDHRRFRVTFAAISTGKMSDQARVKMFFRLLYDLKMHETMEQKEWYPHILKKDNLMLKHLLREEKEAAKAVAAFYRMRPLTVRWWQKFNAFKHDVLHHAHDEETKLFPTVRKHFPKAYLTELGQYMLAFKRKSRPPPARRSLLSRRIGGQSADWPAWPTHVVKHGYYMPSFETSDAYGLPL